MTSVDRPRRPGDTMAAAAGRRVGQGATHADAVDGRTAPVTANAKSIATRGRERATGEESVVVAGKGSVVHQGESGGVRAVWQRKQDGSVGH
eukprot:TRINITY_DN16664_c0_g1_i1.p4 TRINITY_DN16664_c0_g1~~TRINITY_DN16664_c0_g1_i1.p4  ORF type:complete len:106 (+),score=15.98 TRINITY_DN16664_c0_g1_i1:43-318(+)